MSTVNMTSAFITFFGLVLFCQTIFACENTKTMVNADIYYESLCPDSIMFITKQLGPNYNDFKNHLKINLIPYGKATYKKVENQDRYNFVCQHGRNECDGNRAQACAIHVINQDVSESIENRQEYSVKFVECFMSNARSYSVMDIIDKCASTAQLNEDKINEIKSCSNSLLGDQLLAMNGDKTSSLNPRLTFVPTIVINHNYSKENQSAAFTNFRQLICSLISNDCDASNVCLKIEN